MSADGRRAFLGCSMNYAALWTIPQPCGSAPLWLLEFLEGLAGLKFEQREARGVAIPELEKCLQAIRQKAPEDDYVTWAENVIDKGAR